MSIHTNSRSLFVANMHLLYITTKPER